VYRFKKKAKRRVGMTGKFEKYILLAAVVIMLLLIGSCSGTQDSTQVIEKISAREGFNLIQDNLDNQDFVIIDVRTPEEYAVEHIENAININFSSETSRDEMNKLNKDKTYLIYCLSGNRSGQALTVMEELGFKEVYDIGGIAGWKTEGFPTVK